MEDLEGELFNKIKGVYCYLFELLIDMYGEVVKGIVWDLLEYVY